MYRIAAGQFKAKCLKVMEEVRKYHHEVIVTKHNKPMVRVLPVEITAEKHKSVFGCMKGKMVIVGDIIKPIGEVWTADEHNLR
ncbi:MAG: type II toxin-antitoxin system Phd/YefM family antitoxin [Candidatus Firestonebacteria bacterium]|nr:type II toxin-antitoxin system Phd/YefM family antitoxin [Candidatus Firestonebacteria bacterium]